MKRGINFFMNKREKETGDRKRETGNRKKETGNRKRETGEARRRGDAQRCCFILYIQGFVVESFDTNQPARVGQTGLGWFPVTMNAALSGSTRSLDFLIIPYVRDKK